MRKKILVTGAAGFIGFHLTQALLNHDLSVVGIDNLNEYYDILEVYLKISGFWMKDNIYGITYKFSY